MSLDELLIVHDLSCSGAVATGDGSLLICSWHTGCCCEDAQHIRTPSLSQKESQRAPSELEPRVSSSKYAESDNFIPLQLRSVCSLDCLDLSQENAFINKEPFHRLNRSKYYLSIGQNSLKRCWDTQCIATHCMHRFESVSPGGPSTLQDGGTVGCDQYYTDNEYVEARQSRLMITVVFCGGWTVGRPVERCYTHDPSPTPCTPSHDLTDRPIVHPKLRSSCKDQISPAG